MKRFGIIWCVEIEGVEALKQAFASTYSQCEENWDILEPRKDDLIAAAQVYDGFVISGGPQSVVRDRNASSMKKLFEFVAYIDRETTLPIVGVCLGSQLLAEALGGSVRLNKSEGFRLGVSALKWTAQAKQSLPHDTKARPVVAECHGECVASLPRNSIVLASAPENENEVFLISDRFLGIQGHPELSEALFRQTLMQAHRDELSSEEWEKAEAEVARPVYPRPLVNLARKLLSNSKLQMKQHGLSNG